MDDKSLLCRVSSNYWSEQSACARTLCVRQRTQWPLNLALLFFFLFFPSTYFSPRRFAYDFESLHAFLRNKKIRFSQKEMGGGNLPSGWTADVYTLSPSRQRGTGPFLLTPGTWGDQSLSFLHLVFGGTGPLLLSSFFRRDWSLWYLV